MEWTTATETKTGRTNGNYYYQIPNSSEQELKKKGRSAQDRRYEKRAITQ